MRWVPLAVFSVGLAAAAWLGRRSRSEDFMYYYCKGWVERRAQSPYDPQAFQACIEKALGRPNPNLSAALGSAYPPRSWLPFQALAALPYRTAFWGWTLALACAAALAAAGLAGAAGPAAWPLLVVAPGFASCWGYHKLTLLVFCVFVWAMRWLDRGRDELAGAAAGLLSVQPQWLLAAAGFFALRRRWKAAAWACAVAAAPVAWSLATGERGLWSQWAASVGTHAVAAVGLDNQSLFVAFYKPLRFAWPGPTSAILAVRRLLAALMLAAAVLTARGPLRKAWPRYLVFVLLALPYSHGSDALWTLPFLLFAWPGVENARAVTLALLACAAAAALRLRPGAEGYWTLAVLLAAAYAEGGVPDARPRDQLSA